MGFARERAEQPTSKVAAEARAHTVAVKFVAATKQEASEHSEPMLDCNEQACPGARSQRHGSIGNLLPSLKNEH